MDINNFKALCSAMGDQSLPEADRWRSIKYIHADGHPMFDLQEYYKKGRLWLVDVGNTCGFLILDNTLPEIQVTSQPVYNFIDINCVFAVCFDAPMTQTLAEAVQAFGITPEATISFEHDAYAVKAISDVHVQVNNPLALNSVSIAVFETEAAANAATSTKDSAAVRTLIFGQTYYLKAFLEAPFTGTATVPVTIVTDDTNLVTYKFVDEEGIVYKSATVASGSTIVAPENPSKPASDQFTYTFAGWEGFVSGMKVTEDVTFVGKFIKQTRKYTYKFVDYDGTVISTGELEYGSEIIAPTAIPSRPNTAQYTFTFDKWLGYTSGMKITNNVKFTATYTSTVNKYTYVFYDEDGTVISTNELAYGSEIIVPTTTPSKPNTAQHTYKFDKWLGFTPGMKISEDVSFTASYTSTVNKYTYKFMDYDGATILKEETVEYGSEIIAPSSTPTRQNTAQYTFAFDKYIGFTEGMTITKDVSFTASYTSTVNKYTYEFVDYDGTVLKEDTVEYGSEIIVPTTTPTKPNTAQYTFVFDKWLGFTEGMTITENVSFTASYTSTVNKYTYEFVDHDGTVISSGELEYGSEITAPSSIPTRPNTAQYTYEFDTWLGYTPGMTITKDISFTATYTSTVNKYTYVFYDEDRTTVLKEDIVEYGSEIIAPETIPVKDATDTATYEFDKYIGFTEGMTITENVSFTASYIETPIEETPSEEPVE